MGRKLSVKEVARLYKRSPYQVVYAIYQRKLTADKLGGWMWSIDEEDLPAVWPVKRGRPLMKRGE